MPVETDAERAIFVNADEFGSLVAWGESSFAAIFDQPYQLALGNFDEAGIEGSEPAFEARSSDIPAEGGQNDMVTVTSPELPGPTSFRVVEIMPDGTGMTRVRLHEV